VDSGLASEVVFQSDGGGFQQVQHGLWLWRKIGWELAS